ncbi:ephrin type-A receptor 4a-like [Corticium candelabrum]|uniref:ephrin type-A receptor 4a-like n=1 Tax=Corticium candelabrum TaxID=121492 RepID=UPI002E26E8A3|nr:ephrin type-A receptor 4a-like [Corticium candelabrum]
MIVDNTTQAPIQDASKSFHNGTTAGGHFTKRGSTMEVQVYCEPTTQGPIESPVNENGYLVPASTETLGKSQSCNQQTSNQVAVNTTNENEYERAVIGTERDIKNADIVSQSVDTEKAIYALCDADTYVNAPETTSREQNMFTASLKSDDDDKYWEPASTERELYGQLEGQRFRHIDRRDLIDRKEIGSGEFGVVEKAVWHVNDREKLAVAVKTLTSEADVNDRVTFLREGAINGQFRHRNVVRLHGVVTIGSPIMLVLEYMQNGDLKNYLVNQRSDRKCCLPGLNKTLLTMCRDMARGMDYLSRKSFVHRDLAVRNILLDKELTCKIADFGMARDVSDDNYYVTKGGKVPIRWCAPETWSYRRFSSASDVWSYGVVLYEVWSVGQRPFGSISNGEVMEKVEIGYRLPPPPGCSRSLYHLMIDCWHPDTHERPSFGNIVQRLGASNDSFLTNRKGEASIEGNLGDMLDVSENCYRDLQQTYAKY